MTQDSGPLPMTAEQIDAAVSWARGEIGALRWDANNNCWGDEQARKRDEANYLETLITALSQRPTIAATGDEEPLLDKIAREISYAFAGLELGRMSIDGATFQPNVDVIDSACKTAAATLLASIAAVLSEREQRLVDAARALDATLTAVTKASEYVFTMAYTHGMEYRGPQYGNDQQELRSALASYTQPSTPDKAEDLKRAQRWLTGAENTIYESADAEVMSFAQLLADERERCAVIAEGSNITSNPIGPLYGAGWSKAVEVIASRIRKGN